MLTKFNDRQINFESKFFIVLFMLQTLNYSKFSEEKDLHNVYNIEFINCEKKNNIDALWCFESYQNL